MSGQNLPVPTLRIKPQARFDGFRVDLLVTMQVIEDSPDGVVVSQKQLAIEADGAEFHDRTPERAIRDRKRDWQLQAQGLSVFRFADGEVWRDVFGCAREAVGFLTRVVGTGTQRKESRRDFRGAGVL